MVVFRAPNPSGWERGGNREGPPTDTARLFLSPRPILAFAERTCFVWLHRAIPRRREQ